MALVTDGRGFDSASGEAKFGIFRGKLSCRIRVVQSSTKGTFTREGDEDFGASWHDRGLRDGWGGSVAVGKGLMKIPILLPFEISYKFLLSLRFIRRFSSFVDLWWSVCFVCVFNIESVNALGW